MPAFGYNVRKAAQVVAFFALKQGGSINVLKLTKLVYLSDREFMSRYDRPILYDRLVSMEHGPVDSSTLDYINGNLEAAENWDSFVADKANHLVAVSQADMTIEALDELSRLELNVLHAVWEEFKNFSQYEIRDYTHTHCAEWQDPNGSAYDIPYQRVFEALGKKNSQELSREVEDYRSLSGNLSSAQRAI